MEIPPEKIIRFAPHLEGVVEIREPQFSQRLCSHYKPILDDETKTVQCADCDMVLEPFEWLMKWAHKEVAAKSWIVELTREKKRLAAEVSDLKRQIRNLKSTRRRHETACAADKER